MKRNRIKCTHAMLLAIFSFIVILDQLTKYMVRTLMSPYRSLPIVPGFFDLVYVLNKGGAFGIWSSLPSFLRGIIFISFSFVAVLILLIIYWKLDHAQMTRFGIAFLLGGAIGNLLDRLRWGMVVDFFDFYLGNYHWPAFNVADIAICLGLGLVFLDLLKKEDAQDISN